MRRYRLSLASALPAFREFHESSKKLAKPRGLWPGRNPAKSRAWRLARPADGVTAL